MTETSKWMLVDHFTVAQAAALWCGHDPSKSEHDFIDPPPPEYQAVKQMLTGGIISGELAHDASTNAARLIGDHSGTIVTRSDLMKFARSRDELPAFLFDTLAPIEDSMTRREPVTITKEQRVNKGGRPPEYDWDRFTMEIIRRADSNDGLPEKQAELVGEMLGWFSETYDKEPATSVVKSRISKIYRYLGKGKDKAENPGE